MLYIYIIYILYCVDDGTLGNANPKVSLPKGSLPRRSMNLCWASLPNTSPVRYLVAFLLQLQLQQDSIQHTKGCFRPYNSFFRTFCQSLVVNAGIRIYHDAFPLLRYYLLSLITSQAPPYARCQFTPHFLLKAPKNSAFFVLSRCIGSWLTAKVCKVIVGAF